MTAGRILLLDYPYTDTAVEEAALEPRLVVRAAGETLRAAGGAAAAGAAATGAATAGAAPGFEDIEGLLVDMAPVDTALLDALPRLRAVSVIGIGLDRIDLAAAAARGVAVRNVAAGSTEDVATHAVALLLALWRRLPVYHAHVAGGGFDFAAAGHIDSLASQTVGILGFGRCGQATARRLTPFGCRIAAASRSDSPSYAELGVERLPVDDLLRASSALVVTAPLNDTTRDLLDERRLRLLPRGAVVVSVGRGLILDTPAVARLLAEGHLAGAGLDVFRSEPPGPDELAVAVASPNTILTPHAAFYAVDTDLAIRRAACANLLEALALPAPALPVDGAKAPA